VGELPDDATQWYTRNLRIFSNLQHLTTSASDRILLIIGAGHLPILRFPAQSSREHPSRSSRVHRSLARDGGHYIHGRTADNSNGCVNHSMLCSATAWNCLSP